MKNALNIQSELFRVRASTAIIVCSCALGMHADSAQDTRTLATFVPLRHFQTDLGTHVSELTRGAANVRARNAKVRTDVRERNTWALEWLRRSRCVESRNSTGSATLHFGTLSSGSEPMTFDKPPILGRDADFECAEENLVDIGCRHLVYVGPHHRACGSCIVRHLNEAALRITSKISRAWVGDVLALTPLLPVPADAAGVGAPLPDGYIFASSEKLLISLAIPFSLLLFVRDDNFFSEVLNQALKVHGEVSVKR